VCLLFSWYKRLGLSGVATLVIGGLAWGVALCWRAGVGSGVMLQGLCEGSSRFWPGNVGGTRDGA